MILKVEYNRLVYIDFESLFKYNKNENVVEKIKSRIRILLKTEFFERHTIREQDIWF